MERYLLDDIILFFFGDRRGVIVRYVKTRSWTSSSEDNNSQQTRKGQVTGRALGMSGEPIPMTRLYI